jgi:gliding motility-associated-like protein
VKPGDLVTLVLEEKSGDCTIERKFEIQFGGSFGIESENVTICAGEPATLEATAGGTVYNWTGPGISNPNQQTQVVQPPGNAVYNVTVTFSGGCTGTGTVSVAVNPAAETKFPTLTTCEGDPVSILGQTTDVPGIYTLTLQKQITGCDSILTQELIVVPNKTQGTAQVFCPGDSVKVFGEYVSVPGEVCRTFQGSGGCDSTHCVMVSQVPNPALPKQDSALVVALGESVVIETPDGYASYEWTPLGDLSFPNCPNSPNCPDPTASPDTSTLFLLVVKDGNGCRDTAEYRVFVCDETLIHIPNAFTPNGDGANDVFRVVPHEGAEIILSLKVYDRWGKKVYAGSGANAQWDGKIGDKIAPSDVYVWILDYECGGQHRKVSKDVTLLR